MNYKWELIGLGASAAILAGAARSDAVADACHTAGVLNDVQVELAVDMSDQIADQQGTCEDGFLSAGDNEAVNQITAALLVGLGGSMLVESVSSAVRKIRKN